MVHLKVRWRLKGVCVVGHASRKLRHWLQTRTGLWKPKRRIRDTCVYLTPAPVQASQHTRPQIRQWCFCRRYWMKWALQFMHAITASSGIHSGRPQPSCWRCTDCNSSLSAPVWGVPSTPGPVIAPPTATSRPLAASSRSCSFASRCRRADSRARTSPSLRATHCSLAFIVASRSFILSSLALTSVSLAIKIASRSSQLRNLRWNVSSSERRRSTVSFRSASSI
mmetsp:Transcript_49343/g.107196  ORF Transcript_49343/g.107196 Transcript_49343/m.107196 type:complete len:224 (+) Transcript_49343:20-691(+)